MLYVRNASMMAAMGSTCVASCAGAASYFSGGSACHQQKDDEGYQVVVHTLVSRCVRLNHHKV